MSEELFSDEEEDICPVDNEVYEEDALMDSKISIGRFAKIIDEFDSNKDDFDDDEDYVDLYSLGLH